MFKNKFIKKMSKGFTPVLLVIAILSSFLMPLSIMASFSDNGLLSALNDGGEEAATGSHIYAFLNYIDMGKTSNKQIIIWSLFLKMRTSGTLTTTKVLILILPMSIM